MAFFLISSQINQLSGSIARMFKTANTKPAIGHEPAPVLSTSHPHNLLPWYLF